MTPTRAVAYVRIPDYTRPDGGDLTEQYDQIKVYAAANGYKIVMIYYDVADGFQKSPYGLRQMMADAEQGRFNVVLVCERWRLFLFWQQLWRCITMRRLGTVVAVKPRTLKGGRN